MITDLDDPWANSENGVPLSPYPPAVGRREGKVGEFGGACCGAVGVAVTVVVFRILSVRQSFAGLKDPNEYYSVAPVLAQLGVAVLAGLLVAGCVFNLTDVVVKGSTATQAARAVAQVAAAAKAKVERERREKEEAEERTRSRAAKLSQYSVGSEAWWNERRKHQRADVYRETGVTWRHSMYSDARTVSERSARDLMRRLNAEAKQMIAEAELAERNKRLTAAERRNGVTDWKTAERFVANWMRTIFDGVQLTPAGADEGIDVVGDGVVAQVKFQSAKVSRPALQRLLGAAGGSKPLFFALDSPGYAKTAIQWADDNDMALFTYDWDGNVTPANDVADELIAEFEAAGAEERERRRLGRLDHNKAVGIVERWLASQLPGTLSRVGLTASGPVHLTSARLAIAVCLSPTNEVGSPRLQKLVAGADGRRPVFFVSMPKGLSLPATAWAGSHEVAVFGFTYGGRVDPLNQHAQQIQAGLRAQAH